MLRLRHLRRAVAAVLSWDAVDKHRLEQLPCRPCSCLLLLAVFGSATDNVSHPSYNEMLAGELAIFFHAMQGTVGCLPTIVLLVCGSQHVHNIVSSSHTCNASTGTPIGPSMHRKQKARPPKGFTIRYGSGHVRAYLAPYLPSLYPCDMGRRRDEETMSR